MLIPLRKRIKSNVSAFHNSEKGARCFYVLDKSDNALGMVKEK